MERVCGWSLDTILDDQMERDVGMEPTQNIFPLFHFTDLESRDLYSIEQNNDPLDYHRRRPCACKQKY